jgi:hypothetical protein
MFRCLLKRPSRSLHHYHPSSPGTPHTACTRLARRRTRKPSCRLFLSHALRPATYCPPALPLTHATTHQARTDGPRHAHRDRASAPSTPTVHAAAHASLPSGCFSHTPCGLQPTAHRLSSLRTPRPTQPAHLARTLRRSRPHTPRTPLPRKASPARCFSHTPCGLQPTAHRPSPLFCPTTRQACTGSTDGSGAPHRHGPVTGSPHTDAP